MSRITIQLHGELNDFMPAERRERSFAVSWSRRSIKDLPESMGVPHPEIALIVANGAPVDFGYLPEPKTQARSFRAVASYRFRRPFRPAIGASCWTHISASWRIGSGCSASTPATATIMMTTTGADRSR